MKNIAFSQISPLLATCVCLLAEGPLSRGYESSRRKPKQRWSTASSALKVLKQGGVHQVAEVLASCQQHGPFSSLPAHSCRKLHDESVNDSFRTHLYLLLVCSHVNKSHGRPSHTVDKPTGPSATDHRRRRHRTLALAQTGVKSYQCGAPRRQSDLQDSSNPPQHKAKTEVCQNCHPPPLESQRLLPTPHCVGHLTRWSDHGCGGGAAAVV